MKPDAPYSRVDYRRMVAWPERIEREWPLLARVPGFLRLMTPRPDGSVVFTPSTLRYRADSEPALEVVATRNVALTGWRRHDLERAQSAAGFGRREIFGTVGHVPFDPERSPDLVIVAR